MLKSVICPLPWIHLSILPNGQIRLCCHAKEDQIYLDNDSKPLRIGKNSIAEVVESAWIKKIRQQLTSAQELPRSCEGCYASSCHSDSPPHYYNSVFEKIDIPKIHFLDLSLTRVCNLECLMCSPNFSTKLDSLYSKTNEKLPKQPFEREYLDTKDFEFLTQDLKVLLLQGGEPFLASLHIPLLENLIRRKKASQINLSYISNGTLVPSKRILELWSEFSSVKVEISIDDVGERAEFLRYPLRWHDFEKKMEYFVELQSNKTIELDTIFTLQAMNITALPRIFSFLDKYRSSSRVPNVNLLKYPRYLSVDWLPMDFKTQAAGLIEKMIHDTNLTVVERARLDFAKSSINNQHNEDSNCKFDFFFHLTKMRDAHGVKFLGKENLSLQDLI